MNDIIHEVNNEIIARVSRNDPTFTALATNFNRFNDHLADSLGKALQGNNRVRKLHLNVNNLTESDGTYDSLLTAIERSTTLEEITLEGNRGSGRVVDRFLNVMSSTVSIRKVELYDLRNLGTNAFLSLLRSPVSDLELRHCHFADRSQEAYRELAAGFRANMYVQRLVLIDNASELIAASLDGVRFHPAIRHLTVEPLDRETETMDALSNGIGRILSTSSTLTSLELCFFRFSARAFEPILQGLKSNPSVNTFKFSSGHFDKDATDMFVSLFQNNNPIRTFKVMRGNVFQGSPVREVVSRILRSNDTLENLIVGYDRGDVALIFEALHENVSLKTLKLDFFDSFDDADLASLQRNLPKLRGLKKLTFRINGRVRISAESLLQAFEGNGSLEEVEIIQDIGFELFNTEALAKIQSFCRRNKKLSPFLAAPVDAVLPSRASRHRSNDGASQHTSLSDPVMNLRLRPKVYVVAQKIEAGGNRMIFRDLIRLGDLIGGDGGESSKERSSDSKSGKRKRSDTQV